MIHSITSAKGVLVHLSIASLLLLCACSKAIVIPEDGNELTKGRQPEQLAKKGGSNNTSYQAYTIQAGNHQCDQSGIKSVRTSEMKFLVKFDQSAIYTTANPDNQADINKLWGFTEGVSNSYNSARFGWNWVDNELRLHAYVYNKGVRSYSFITSVAIGAEISCSIKVSGSSYIFTANGISVTMGRGATGSTASGYQQYPYFGGDEVAPHKITILIKPA